MKNKYLSTILKDKPNYNFHDETIINTLIDKDIFKLRLLIDNKCTDCNILNLNNEDKPASKKSNDIYILDLVIKNPKYSFDSFNSFSVFSTSSILDISINNIDNKYKTEISIQSSYYNNFGQTFSKIVVESSEYYFNVVGHIFDYDNEDEMYSYINKNYLNFNRGN